MYQLVLMGMQDFVHMIFGQKALTSLKERVNFTADINVNSGYKLRDYFEERINKRMLIFKIRFECF